MSSKEDRNFSCKECTIKAENEKIFVVEVEMGDGRPFLTDYHWFLTLYITMNCGALKKIHLRNTSRNSTLISLGLGPEH